MTILDECPFPTRETLDRLSPVDRIRTWQTWQRKYPDAPAADRATVVRIIDHATKSYDVSEDDRRVLRAEAQRGIHAPAPRSATAAVRPAQRALRVDEERRRKSWDEAARLMLAAQATPAAAPAQATSNRASYAEHMHRKVLSANDGTTTNVAAPAPRPAKARDGEVGLYAFCKRLGDWTLGTFEHHFANDRLPKPSRIEGGNRFWTEAAVAATVAKIGK